MEATIGKILSVLVIAIGALGVVALVCLLLSIPVYFLWNWLMPTLFGLKQITLLQSLGLLILSNLLFKGTSSSTKKE
jgi:hypothetical protein